MPVTEPNTSLQNYPMSRLGVNINKNIVELIPEECLLSQNMVYKNGMRKRDGIRKINENEVVASSRILGIHAYYYSTNKQLLVACDTIVARESGGDWTNIITGLLTSTWTSNSSFSTSGFTLIPQALSIASDGTIWIADSANDKIWHRTAEGSAISSFSFTAPTGVAILSDNTLWVSTATKLSHVSSSGIDVSKGYILGGWTTTYTNVIEDLAFSTETSAAITATLDTAKYGGAGVSSSTKGYILGGYTGSAVNVIEQITFADETSAAITATLDTAKYSGAGVNSSTKGYILGGFTTTYTNVIEQITFSNETSAAITATLDTAKYLDVGVNSSTKGYILGGYTGSYTNVIEQITFADETSAAITATLDTAKGGGAGVSSSTKGYILGGFAASRTNVIEQITFADETSAAITATLDTAKDQDTGVSSSAKGYILGGNTGSATAVIEDLNFSDETSAAIAATLDTAKYLGTGVQSSQNTSIFTLGKGYALGGDETSTIEDLNFADETSSAITATLDSGKSRAAGVSSSTKGYTLGGYTGSATTDVIEQVTFADETSAAITATLDTAKNFGVGVSGSAKGYILGGITNVTTAVIEQITFADETSAAITATLDAAKDSGAGVSSSTKGYILGGRNGSSNEIDVIEQITFSDETSAAITATLDTTKDTGVGVNSSTKGYILGGDTGSGVPSRTAVIEQITFSDETSAAITATLDTAKHQGAGVSSSTKGYILGGLVASTTAVIEQITFADETSAAITATLDTAKDEATGVQSSPSITGVSVDTSGNLWYTDDAIDRVDKMDTSGAPQTNFLTSAFDASATAPSDVTAASDGTLWVIDDNTNKIYNVDTSGTLIDSFPTTNIDASATTPTGISIDSSSNIWFCDSNTDKVYKTQLTSANTFFTTWGGTSKVYVCNGLEKPRSWDGSATATITAAPALTKQLLPYQDRLLSIDNTNRGFLRWSASFSDTGVWETAGACNVKPDTDIHGMVIHSVNNQTSTQQSSVLLAGSNGMYLFHGNDLSVSGAGDYTIHSLGTSVGCNAPRTMKWTPIGTMWLGIDKQVYLLQFNSLTPIPISQKIHSNTSAFLGLEQMASSQIANATAEYHDGYYKLYFAGSGSVTNNTQFWLDVSRFYKDDLGHYGPWYGPMTGQEILCTAVQSGNGDSGELLLGEHNATTGGFVYIQDKTQVFGDNADTLGNNGNAIACSWQTLYNSLGNSNYKKKIHSIEIELLTLSDTITLSFDDIHASLASDSLFTATGTTDKPTRKLLRVSPTLDCRRASLSFAHSSQSNDFQIYSVTAEAKETGKVFA